MRSRLAALASALVLSGAGFAGEPPAIPKSDPPAVVFEVRVLTLADDFFFERVGIDFDAKAGAPAQVRNSRLESGTLTDAQLSTLLETVQADRRCNVMQAPKVTTDSGQDVVVQVTEQRGFMTRLEAVSVQGQPVLVPKETMTELGMKLALTGRVSADGKSVETRVKYTDTQVVGEVPLVPVVTQIAPVLKDGKRGKPVPFTQYLQVPEFETITIEKADLVIPAGGHVLLVGPARVREARQEFGPPVLSKVPYLNRMYRNVGVGRETTRTVLVVSAAVIEPQE